MTSSSDSVLTAELEIDTSKPANFEGKIKTNNDLPAPDVMLRVGRLEILDHKQNILQFQEVVQTHEKTLVVFVRHFFCGNCQDYIQTLCEEIPPEKVPRNTSIVIIGCGNPDLIDMYRETTGCKYPLYSDPNRKIFNTLGMIKTLELGEKPKYMRRSLPTAIVASIMQGLKQIPTGLALKSGDHRQVGGEFLFELVDGLWQVTWCHRMQTTRDHAEMDEIKTILELEEEIDETDGQL